MNFKLLYEDDAVLGLDKPSGLLSVPGVGPDKKDCLSSRVQADYPEATVIHRLDRDTSGVMIMARTAEAHRHLSRQFEERQTEKRYHAVVVGVPDESTGEIDLPIHRDWEQHDPPMYKIDHERGKPSITRWTILESQSDCSILELRPVTGRSHQLRLHLKVIGHPILGDPIYAPQNVIAMADRLMLHATRLRFTHPSTGQPLTIEADCPWWPPRSS